MEKFYNPKVIIGIVILLQISLITTYFLIPEFIFYDIEYINEKNFTINDKPSNIELVNYLFIVKYTLILIFSVGLISMIMEIFDYNSQEDNRKINTQASLISVFIHSLIIFLFTMICINIPLIFADNFIKFSPLLVTTYIIYSLIFIGYNVIGISKYSDRGESSKILVLDSYNKIRIGPGNHKIKAYLTKYFFSLSNYKEEIEELHKKLKTTLS